MYCIGSFEFSTATVAVDKEENLTYPCRYPSLPFGQKDRVLTQGSGGLKHAVMLTSDGKLFGIGSNHAGQMGASLGAYSNTVRQLTVELRFPVVQVACGARFTLLRCSDGSVYSAGDNTFGQLGRKSKSKDFAQVQLPANIANIACGADTCFAINTSGQVFSWGNAEFGSLGHGDKGEHLDPVSLLPISVPVETPKVIEWFVKKKIAILGVSAGKSHVLFRSQADVYACGDGTFGKLGNGDIDAVVLPTRIEFPTRRDIEVNLDVAAGDHHSLFLRRNSLHQTVVYLSGKPGSNADGMLTPVHLPSAPLNIASIAAGKQMSVAVTESGQMFVWGMWPQLSSMGLTNEATRSVPSVVAPLSNFFVTHVIVCQTFMAVLTNDEKAKAGSCLDVVVPFAHRGEADGAQRYETFAKKFFQKILGEGAGTAYAAQIPEAPPMPVKEKPAYTKQGTKAFTVGSKIRLWMTDVYGLATVTELPKATTAAKGNPPQAVKAATQKRATKAAIGAGAESQTAAEEAPLGEQSVLVEWARDDWYPEVVELDSDDETQDEENPNRWQHGWFLEPPVSASS